MRLVPLLALCLAAPLAAQTSDPTPPERYYPLSVGDVREYKTTVIWPASPPSYLRESVVGTTQVDGQTYHLVDAVAYNVSGVETSRQTRLVRFDSALAVPVERQANGTEVPITPCRLDLPFGPLGSSDDCPFYSGSPAEIVFGVPTSVKTFVNLIGDVGYAAGFGFVSSDIEEGQQVETRLRYARIGGVTYGTPDPILPPLAPEPEAYWPLEVGNMWVHRLGGNDVRLWRVVGTEVISDTTYALVERCPSRFPDGTPTCDTEPVRVDNRLGEIRVRVGGHEERLMCGLLPTAVGGWGECDVRWSVGTPWWLHIIEPVTFRIGADTVSTASLRLLGNLPRTFGFAAGIGPFPDETTAGTGVFEYARIGGVEYGVNPVAGEARPSAPALALRASPTPTDGAVTIAVGGATSPAAVEVFDALGRQVWRGTVVGETALDTRAWAPGVYVVRATADGATATTRLVRR